MVEVVILAPDRMINILVPEYHSGQAIGDSHTILSSAAAKELNDYLKSDDVKLKSEWTLDFDNHE